MTEEEQDYVEESNEENHPAIVAIKNLLESGQISEETFNALNYKFKKLHQAFSQSCSTEQILLRKTRELGKELKDQKLTIQSFASQQQDHRSALTTLRQHLANIQTELDSTREQIENTKANTDIKIKEREKLAEKVSKARDDRRLKLEPQRKQIQSENSSLESEINILQKNIESLKQQGQDQRVLIERDEEQLAEIEKKKRAYNQKMVEIGSQPVKTRQRVASVENAHSTLLSEEKTANNQLLAAETTLQELHTKAHDLETEYQNILNDIDGMIVATSDMKAKGEELKAKCNEQTNVKQQRDYESKEILNQISEMNKEISNLEQKIEATGKDIVKKEKDTQKIDEAIANQHVDKKTLESQLHTLTLDATKEEQNNLKLGQDLQKAIEARENAFKAFVAMEGVTQDIMNEIKAVLQDKDKKQSIHDQLSKKEYELERQLVEASLIRDRKAREMASMKKKTLDAKTRAMESNIDYLDLCRKQDDILRKLREYSDLYEKVKLDRNRYVNTIQTSRQLIVELKEKIRILDNEVEVLRREFEAVDAEVRLKKQELDLAFSRRNNTKSDLKRAESKYSELNQKIDYQNTETRRLNKIMKNIEDHIIQHQKRFQIQTDDCQNIQRMLIDKGDELCMIYEELNKHEEVMKRGEIGLREREEELRLLNLQLNDFQRRIQIMLRKGPQIKAYDEEIKDLDTQLAKEQKDVDDITRRLENPEEKARSRAYCGKDFTLKELEQKVATYEQRINSKEQQLWEKQILLREIEEKVAELSKDAKKDVSKAEKILKKNGTMRSEAMALRRKKLAGFAELALYEAEKAALEEEKAAVKEEMEQSIQRAERGEAFDEYAQRIITMHKRDIERARIASIQQEEEDDEDRPRGRAHYDAYRDERLGIAKPYGGFPAFQPAPPSGQLRHFRNETQRPIEL